MKLLSLQRSTDSTIHKFPIHFIPKNTNRSNGPSHTRTFSFSITSSYGGQCLAQASTYFIWSVSVEKWVIEEDLVRRSFSHECTIYLSQTGCNWVSAVRHQLKCEIHFLWILNKVVWQTVISLNSNIRLIR